MAKKHIALVSVDTFDPNLADGGSRAVYEALRFLRCRNHRVAFYNFYSNERCRLRNFCPDLYPAQKGDSTGNLADDGIIVCEHPVSSSYHQSVVPDGFLPQVMDVLRGEPVDLAITGDADYLALLAVSILNLPGVHIFNASGNIERFRMLPVSLRGMLRKRAVLTVSDYLRKMIKRRLNVSSDVWFNRFDFACGAGPSLNGNSAVGFYSSGTKTKGEDVVRKLLEMIPSTPVVVAGHALSGPVEDFPCPPNLFNIGWVDDIGRFFEQVKVLIVPSLIDEGFSRIILEASMRGIPVIANRIGGIPEALGESGILVGLGRKESLDIDRLATIYRSHVENLLSNKEVYDKYRRQALNRAAAYRDMQERNSQEIYDKYFA
ncbi:MAG TPA: glycosyltransferase [Syntrophales bacterium]|nr:glycosyltransferase [Syntrophales bacterium]HOX93338.1 glycosyltransferase [Syntrophales bacterium]HPI56539.1 glycosyltransferase [Syntrophales bacterium]HPN25040.1 glycosyltransferase [Syntrophales bacterium]HQM29217.1 glycosyltransferase [Syntrophales bacterium]